MKFFRKAEFVLPTTVLLFGLAWVIFSEEMNETVHSVRAVFANPDMYQDAFFVVAVSIVLLVVLRGHRLKSDRWAKEIRKLSLVAENTGNGVIILDQYGKIEWVNDAFTRISGYSLEDVKGKHPAAVLHGDKTDPNVGAELKQHAYEGKSISREIVNYNKDGIPYWTHVSLSPVYSGRKLEYTISVHTDVSQMKMKEQKIECQNRQLKEIAFKISHLVRAPLANILGLTAVIKANGCANETNEELLELLEVSAAQLDKMIKDIVLQAAQTNEG